MLALLLATSRSTSALVLSPPPYAVASFSSRHLRTSSIVMGRKPGVMEPPELAKFVADAGDKLIIVDVRNPDFEVEPGDGKSNEKAPLAACGTDARARAVNVFYDRTTNSMDLSKIPEACIEAGGGKASVPVITHCGGGGRGQKAKDFLLANGFANVANGGGPEDDECWECFGSK